MNLCLLLREDAFLAWDSFQRETRPLPSQVARATPTDCFSPDGHPPFAPFFRAHIFRQVISWSFKHFSRLKWNKMRVFQKHFHNFFAVVRIPHCDFLVCLTWIRPIPPKSPPRYSIFYPIFPKYILDFRGQTSYWTLGYILKCEWLSLVEWNPLYDLAWFVSQPSKI